MISARAGDLPSGFYAPQNLADLRDYVEACRRIARELTAIPPAGLPAATEASAPGRDPVAQVEPTTDPPPAPEVGHQVDATAVTVARDVAPPRSAREAPTPAPNPGALEAWTDGSGTTREQLAGIGVVIAQDGVVLCEASSAIGQGSNNIAEVRAIGRALVLARAIAGDRDADLIVYSDSEFALGAVDPRCTWQLRSNPDLGLLAAGIRREASHWPRLRFVHVPGHAGLPFNERADQLAGHARKTAVARAAGLPPPTMKEPGTRARRPRATLAAQPSLPSVDVPVAVAGGPDA